jgi:hypothetical protein
MSNIRWSTAAHRCHKAAVSARKSQAQLDAELERMRTGPYFAGDILIVPSEWYNEKAAEFWGQHGFRYSREANAWQRDIRTLFHGKRYSAQAWITSTRQEFFKFWPGLAEKRRNEND